ncbi:uncharacterized protein KY384_002231 [Bacidia gigantensis]|uniref:uncharacterized protein n=1 Tax=Bacidia gigantensis TaxID=2732470 RepID=UPI001D054270|nr:uncharacterized protein KY384_002231 [Bacidia gigantensis]KAG8533448.1 hypothetical protein KY384_002231 [Bacidia gigantensis]
MDYIPYLTREPTLFEKAWSTVTYPVNVFYHPIESLVSLPALSFLIIPAFSSYGTTLNFLFFYMTWAILIKSNPPLQVELIGTAGIRVLFYLVPSTLFLALDSLAPDFAQSLKEHGEDALATGEAQGGPQGRWWKVTLVSVFNVTLGVFLQTGVDVLFTKVLGIRSAIKISTNLPMPWTIALQLALGLLLREVLTYAVLRFVLHGQKSRLKTWHEGWQHSVVAPFSFVAHYDHPAAYLLHVFLPMYLPAVLLRMHLLTYHMYMIIVSLEETFAYSGYNVLPTAFILGGIARRQERHLMGDGDGNFGCFGLADLIMGTSLSDDLVEDVVDEAEEKQVAKKAKGKAKSVKKKARKHAPKHDKQEEEDDSEPTEEQTSESHSRSRPARGRNGKQKARSEDTEADQHQDEDEKPKKKKAANAKKVNGRRKKRSSDED